MLRSGSILTRGTRCTFVDVVGVDAVLSLRQRTVLLRLTVEQEAVLIAGVLVGVEHSHVALCTFRHKHMESPCCEASYSF